MTMTLVTIALRMLKHTEGLLAELNSPLADAACHDVHMARLNVETLARVDVRNSLANHVTGERAA